MAAEFGLITLFFVTMSGNFPTDAVSLVPTPHYFETRRIDASVEKLMELASTNPSDAKSHITQLVAFKALLEDAAKLKQHAKFADHRKKIEAIAAGKEAQDPAGFAREYAQRLLNKLDGTETKATELPARFFEEGLSWFPAKADLLMLMDSRGSRNEAALQRLYRSLLPLVSDEQKSQVYDFLEKIGNVQIDRFSVAFVNTKTKARFLRDKEDPNTLRPDLEINIRMTGRANQKWLASALAKQDDSTLQEAKGANGEPILFVTKAGKSPPSVAFINNTDLVMSGYGEWHQGDHGKLLEAILDVRQGKADNVFKGPLAADLKKLPDRAHALAVGKLLEVMKRDIPFAPPMKFTAHALRVPQGQDFSGEVTFEDAQSAAEVVKQVSEGRKMALASLKMLQEMNVPNVNVGALVAVVESLQIQSKDQTVSARILVTDEAILTLPTLLSSLRIHADRR